MGTIVAGVTSQVAYAAAPLTLALSLNLINRQRFLTQTRANSSTTNAAISLLERELRGDLESVRASTQSSPLIERLRDLEASMLRLSTLWMQVQNRLDQPATAAGDPKVQEELTIIRRAIVRLRDSTDAQIIDVRQSLLEEIELLRQLISQTTPETIAEPAESVPVQNTEIQSSPAINLEEFAGTLIQLQQRIEQLEHKNRTIVKPYLKHLIDEVRLLKEQSNIEPIQEALTSLTEQIEHLANELDSQLNSQQMQGIHSAIAKVSESIAERQRSPETQPQRVINLE